MCNYVLKLEMFVTLVFWRFDAVIFLISSFVFNWYILTLAAAFIVGFLVYFLSLWLCCAAWSKRVFAAVFYKAEPVYANISPLPQLNSRYAFAISVVLLPVVF